MRRHRTDFAVIWCAAIALITACDTVERARSRFGKTTTDTIRTATGSGVVLGLQAPPMLRPGDEGVLRLSLTNRTDTAVSHVRLELIVPAWAEPVPPSVGDPPVTMAALETGSTQFSYRLDDAPLNPGQLRTVNQRIRIPTAGALSRGNAPWSRTVSARLLTADGQMLSEVQTEIAVDSAGMATTSSMAPVSPARRERVGPVVLGMTATAARNAVPNARDTTWTQGSVPQRGLLVPVSGRTALAILSADTVTRIEIDHAAIRTNERLGVGSRLDELRAAYGGHCADVIAGRVVVWFASAPGLVFALNTPAPSNPAQLDASRLPGTARVMRWWLSRDIEACATGG